MSFRRFAETCIAGSAFALALTLATPALAQPVDAGAMPAAPDMRPEWRPGLPGASAAMQPAAMLPDSRARDAWLRECRRRTEMYYDGYRSHRRRDKDRSYSPGYDYCEAYFDDYYRTYTQPGYGHAHHHMSYVQPVAMPATRVVQTSQPIEEVITEEYVPVRSRTIPQRRTIRRPMRDKRIRIAP
jgi:hypothetical protein